MASMIRTKPLFIILISLSLVSVLLSLTLGSVPLSVATLKSVFLGHAQTWQQQIIFQLRLPRTINGFVTGGELALAGSLLQVLLRNPLADPYVLGISGGAAVSSLIALLLGLSGISLQLSAFAGALISMLLVFLLARSPNHWSSTRLLLTGIIIASGWSAAISFILSITQAHSLPNLLFWLMGDLSANHYPLPNSLLLCAGLIYSMLLARPLNLMAKGELLAKTMGLNTKNLNLQIYVLSSLLTATAVSTAGTIGFIGLVVPHIIRLLIGSDHRLVLPASVLLGGILLCLADALARTIMAPMQLPVGIITALIGVPFFLLLLHRNHR